MMWKRFILYLALWAAFFQPQLSAQQKPSTAADALSLFKEQKFAEAARVYEQLLEQNDRNVANNYYYGICLYKLNHKTDEALRRLKFSATRPVSQDVYYYLGRLYQQAYEMELAIDNLERFQKSIKDDHPLSKDVQTALEECQSGLRLINKYFDIKVINKDTIAKTELVSAYHLSKDAGQLMTAGDFFRTGVDPHQVAFRTERGNEVYFPIQEMDESWNIYKIVRLLDSWSEAEILQEPINTEWDEMFPFLLTDGVTLYFSSKRPGGMGGYDIYQSFYDPESRTFSPPANLGPPFNSPADDYLLTPDGFSQRAWFATNRGVAADSVVVAEIIWDDSVIKNNTESIHQLKTLATLPLSPEAENLRKESANGKNGNGKDRQKSEIHFVLNDTLVYTRFDQFQSDEALGVFRNGFKTEQKKDSLNNLMARKRKAYAQSYNQTEIKQLIDEIVSLEKQTYGLDNEINSYYIHARRLELEKIRQLINDGTYLQKTKAIPVPVKTSTLRPDLARFNLKDFSYYTDEDFIKRTAELNQMYAQFFTVDQTFRLQKADSLYLWAKVLNLESARVLEQTRTLPPTTVNPLNQLIKKTDEEEESPELVALIHQSREMKRLSLDLYEEALNTKYGIYYPVAVEFNSTSNQTGSEYMLNQASSNFRKAEEEKAAMILYNAENLERLLALKKQSVDLLEESFNIQALGNIPLKQPANDDRFSFAEAAATPSYPMIQKGEDALEPVKTVAETPPPAQVVAAAIKKAEPEYKIQIGAFRNTPDQTALGKIPAVTSMEVPGNGLKKYFSGSWKTYAEAQAMVQSIREAGFPGAFVVAFIQGEQITIEKAKELENAKN